MTEDLTLGFASASHHRKQHEQINTHIGLSSSSRVVFTVTKTTLTMASTADTPVARRLQHVRHIIIVCSGKGGVGKSSVSAQLAISLRNSTPTTRVGVLDVDLTGPSIPRMLQLDGHPVHQSSDGWVPVYADGSEARLACMSVGFLLKKKEDSVVWRGPKKNAMIRQFLSDVRWGELDYLVIDTPPGAPVCIAHVDKWTCMY